MQIQHANMSETFLDWRYMFSSNHFNPTFRTNFPKEELELYQQAIVFEDNLWIETEAFYGNNIPLPSHHSFHSYPNKDCSRFWKIFDLLKKRKEEGNRYWMWLDEFEIYPVYSYQWEQQQNQKKMKTEKITTLTLEIAKQMFVSNVESLKQFALHHYTEEELTKKEFPKSWNDVKNTCRFGLSVVVFQTITEAEKFAMLTKLITLRDEWWKIDGNWKPDWKDYTYKYAINTIHNEIDKERVLSLNKIFAFRTEEIRDEFLETFRESLEICKSLI